MITPADLALLEALPALAFHAALVFCRMGAAVMLLPGLGESEIPVTQRLALGLLLVLALTPVLSPGLPPLPAEVAPLLVLVASEVLLGAWIGLCARFIALALAQAGQVIALMMGLASPLQGDAFLGGSATAPARMLGLLTACLFLSTGLYELPLRALAGSYAALPPGGEWPLGDAAALLTRVVAGVMNAAMQLAAPFVLAAIFFNAAMGLLARVAPQLQVFVVAAPAQLLGGFLLLILLMPALFHAWWGGTGEALRRLPGLG